MPPPIPSPWNIPHSEDRLHRAEYLTLCGCIHNLVLSSRGSPRALCIQLMPHSWPGGDEWARVHLKPALELVPEAEMKLWHLLLSQACFCKAGGSPRCFVCELVTWKKELCSVSSCVCWDFLWFWRKGSKWNLSWVMAKTWQHELSCRFMYFAAEQVRVAPAGGCAASSLVSFLCLWDWSSRDDLVNSHVLCRENLTVLTFLSGSCLSFELISQTSSPDISSSVNA